PQRLPHSLFSDMADRGCGCLPGCNDDEGNGSVVLPVILFAMALMMTLREANGARTVRARAAVFRVRLVSAIRQTLPFAGVTLVYLLCRLSALKGRLSPATQHLAWSTVL